MSDLYKSLFDLSGTAAFITGASSGLGYQFSRTLAKAGCFIIAAARREKELFQLCNEIERENGKAIPIKLDVSDTKSIDNAITKAIDIVGKINILINNAGISALTPISHNDTQLWDKHFTVNTRGAWLLIQAFSYHMIQRKIQGSIINVASINGDQSPYYQASAYCASKAALIHLTKQLVGELSPHKIRINAIIPGLFYTDMTKNKINSTPDKFSSKIPLGFVAEPSDLDATILLLSSNKASRYITGTCFTVDGGVSANCNVV